MRLRRGMPSILDPDRVRKGEQFWFEDFAGFDVVFECSVNYDDEPPELNAIWVCGQGEEWKLWPWGMIPRWFWRDAQEAIDEAFYHGYEEYDYLTDRADREYGEDAA